MYVEIDLGGPVSFGTYSYITDGLELVGFKSIFAERPVEWLMPQPEEIRQANPEIIIYEPKMNSVKNRTLVEVQRLFADRGLGDLPAVQQGRIAIVPTRTDFLAHHGPGFILRALPWLQQVYQKALEWIG